jgi:hypothetical protein
VLYLEAELAVILGTELLAVRVSALNEQLLEKPFP